MEVSDDIRGRPQTTVSRTRIARYIPKATNTHSNYVIIIAFPQQQWLHESASILRYTYNAVLLHMIMSNKQNNMLQDFLLCSKPYETS